MNETPVSNAIRRKLQDAFAPMELIIEDESRKHAGHTGARPEGETHFRVRIVSAAFADLSRVERQRRVHDALKEELKTRIHALTLQILSPDEAE